MYGPLQQYAAFIIAGRLLGGFLWLLLQPLDGDFYLFFPHAKLLLRFNIRRLGVAIVIKHSEHVEGIPTVTIAIKCVAAAVVKAAIFLKPHHNRSYMRVPARARVPFHALKFSSQLI